MTHPTFLPPGATPLEEAIEQATARLSSVPVPIRNVWSATNCPIESLPWLAWGLSIDNWSSEWSEAIKRERVRQAIPIARRKGTAASVRAIVASFGGSVAIREWWQMEPRGEPHTFSLTMNLEQDGVPSSAAFVDSVISEVTRAKPVRSHFTFTQGITGKASIGLIATVRPAIYARLSCTAPAAA